VELIEEGYVYGLAIPEGTLAGSITSFHIANQITGGLKDVEERYYVEVKTDSDGKGQLVFDELKDDTKYDIYFTAGNNVPYKPKNYLPDSEIQVLQVETLKNPNLGTEAQVSATYS